MRKTNHPLIVGQASRQLSSDQSQKNHLAWTWKEKYYDITNDISSCWWIEDWRVRLTKPRSAKYLGRVTLLNGISSSWGHRSWTLRPWDHAYIRQVCGGKGRRIRVRLQLVDIYERDDWFVFSLDSHCLHRFTKAWISIFRSRSRPEGPGISQRWGIICSSSTGLGIPG